MDHATVTTNYAGYKDLLAFATARLPGRRCWAIEAQAALREVQEETSLRCRLGREVGTSAYPDPKRRPKTVRYWEMTPTAGTLGAANEIDDARWVPLGEAPVLLTYDDDRRFLQGWQPAG